MPPTSSLQRFLRPCLDTHPRVRRGAPPSGWWIMMRAFGMDMRFPLVPAQRRKAPMDAASPKHTVDTSHLTICADRGSRQHRHGDTTGAS